MPDVIMKVIFMKKMVLLFSGFFLFFMATQAGADCLVGDFDEPSITLTNESSYWTGEDYNDFFNDQLKNANPKTEEAWLEALLGFSYDNSDIYNIGRISVEENASGKSDKQLFDYYPGFEWDYAVVKYGNYWIAYADTDNNDRLTTDIFTKGVGHITFFDSSSTNVLPEPSTMLLFGFGLLGLAGYRRMRKGFSKR